MNPITRLYRHFFPSEPSCFTKGLIKGLNEQKPLVCSDGLSCIPFDIDGHLVEIDYNHFQEAFQITVGKTIMHLSRSDGRFLKRATKALREIQEKQETARIESVQAPIIAAIEKVGCPEIS